MAIATADQVIWPALNVTTDGSGAAYTYGDILPAATTLADVAVRYNLRAAGATRAVTTASTDPDLATALGTAATENRAREARATGTTLADYPVVVCVGSLPVVDTS